MMLEQSGAAVCMMSGSGPTLFALYETKDLRECRPAGLTERLDPESRLIAVKHAPTVR
jgi:4-diphosphocytidyl-2C-methyl-D-erythritol kinase